MLRLEPAELDHRPAQQRIHDAPHARETPGHEQIAGRMHEVGRDPAVHPKDGDAEQRRCEHYRHDATAHESTLIVRQAGRIASRPEDHDARDELGQRRQSDERAVHPTEEIVVLDCGEEQPRDRHDSGERRQDHEPVEQHVPDDHRGRSPCIRRKQAELRGQVIAVLPQVADRLRLGLEGVRAREFFELIERTLVMMHPRLQPARDIAAAGNARQKVEALKDAEVREVLKYAEVEGRAADAASGEADR